MEIIVREAALSDPHDAAAVVDLIDGYARGAGGQSRALTAEARERMIPGLAEHPAALVLLGCIGDERAGLAVCFWGFSTFTGHPFVNIHDLAVAPAYQRRGVGRAIISDVFERARARGSSKVTLEVHDSNEGAKRLYSSMGFGPWNPVTLSVTRHL